MNDTVFMFFAIIVGILLFITGIVCSNYNLLSESTCTYASCAGGAIIGIICGAKLAKVM